MTGGADELRPGWDVFVSYSRTDSVRVLALVDRLRGQGIRVWVDVGDIRPSVDWRAEIRAGIDESDAVLVALSAASLTSTECDVEWSYAVECGKRLIPVELGEVDRTTIRPEIAALQSVRADTDDALAAEVLAALALRAEDARLHTAVGLRGRAWESNGDASGLLRGAELDAALDWLARAPSDPRPTESQRRYVDASREAATARREKAELAASLVRELVADADDPQAWNPFTDTVSREPVSREQVPHNLPSPATPFLGRADEVEQLHARLTDPAVRVVTLVGTGGIGKTRVAVEAAARSLEEFPEGVWWLPLAPLGSSEVALSSLAGVIDAAPTGGSLIDDLAARIGAHRMLVLLDNAEHLLPDLARQVSALAARTPHTMYLITSRERLRIQAENVVQLDVLSEPDATALFVARAAAAGVTLQADDDVARLCDRLDRIPLAIELVSARTSLFSVPQILDSLGHLLDDYSGPLDAEERQQTLRSTLTWSYELLDDAEKNAFRGMSVFTGGAPVDGAITVTGASAAVVASLLDKSLLRRRDGAVGPRVWMLETVRELSRDLAAGEANDLRRRHLTWLRSLVDGLPCRNPLRLGASALARLADERDNARAALAHCRDSDPAAYADIASTWWGDLYFGGLTVEATDLLRSALSLSDEPLVRARLLHGLVAIEYRGSESHGVSALSDDELAMAEASGDALQLVDAWRNVGMSRLASDDDAGCIEASRRSLAVAERIGDEYGISAALNNIGNSLMNLGELEEAVTYFARSTALAEETGADFTITLGVSNTADALIGLGRVEEVVPLVRRVFDHEWVEQRVWAIDAVAQLALADGRTREHVVLASAATEAFTSLHQPREGFALRRHHEAQDRATSVLGEVEYAEAEAAGRRLSIDSAHDLARTLLGSF